METKKIFTVMPSNVSPSIGPYVFSEKDKAEKLASFLNKNINLSCYIECETRLVELDQLPILEQSIEIPAFAFLRGMHFFEDKIWSSVTDTQEDDCARFRLSIHNFQMPIPKKGFFGTWEDLFLRAAAIIFEATCYHRLTESEIENDSFSEDIKPKAIELLHEFSKDWFSRVTEEYPVTSVNVGEENMSFYIHKYHSREYLDESFFDQRKIKNEPDSIHYRKGEHCDQYFFATKNGQIFLDSFSEKIRNES